MTPSGYNEFSCEIPNCSDLLFNIEYNAPEFGIYGYYIAGGKEYTGSSIPNRFDPHGLKYGNIYINDQLIYNSYTIINNSEAGLDIAVKINDDNTIIPLQNPSYQHYTIDDRIPSEMPHHHAYRNLDYPSNEDISITGWVIAVTDNNSMNTCQIIIDYTQLFGKINGTWTLLAENNYTFYNPSDDGGLFLRYPFFANNNEVDPMPGTTNGDNLTITPSDEIKKVWHWWTPRFYSDNWSQYEAYKIECKLQVTGQGIIQSGIDFRTSNGNIHELGCSELYFEEYNNTQIATFNTEDISTSISDVTDTNKTACVSITDHSIKLKYNNLTPGNYTIAIYNDLAQEIYSDNLQLLTSSGTWHSSFEYNNASVLYYSIQNNLIKLSGTCINIQF